MTDSTIATVRAFRIDIIDRVTPRRRELDYESAMNNVEVWERHGGEMDDEAFHILFGNEQVAWFDMFGDLVPHDHPDRGAPPDWMQEIDV